MFSFLDKELSPPRRRIKLEEQALSDNEEILHSLSDDEKVSSDSDKEELSMINNYDDVSIISDPMSGKYVFLFKLFLHTFEELLIFQLHLYSISIDIMQSLSRIDSIVYLTKK